MLVSSGGSMWVTDKYNRVLGLARQYTSVVFQHGYKDEWELPGDLGVEDVSPGRGD